MGGVDLVERWSSKKNEGDGDMLGIHYLLTFYFSLSPSPPVPPA